jgi:hypothetical protein
MGNSAPMSLTRVLQKWTLSSGKKEGCTTVVRESKSLVHPIYFYSGKAWRFIVILLPRRRINCLAIREPSASPTMEVESSISTVSGPAGGKALLVKALRQERLGKTCCGTCLNRVMM